MPGATSKRIFKEYGLPNIAKTTPKRVLVKMSVIESMIKRPSMTPRHKRFRMEWSRKMHMKMHMKFVLVTDESRASLVGLDGWAKGWDSNCDNCPTRTGR